MKRNFKISNFPPVLEKKNHKHFPPTHEKYVHKAGLPLCLRAFSMTKQHAGRCTVSTPLSRAWHCSRSRYNKKIPACTRCHACMHTQVLGGPTFTHRTTPAPCACVHHGPENAQRDVVSVHMALVQSQLVLLQSWLGQVHALGALTCS